LIDTFATIKETLNIADITAFYGIEVKRNSQALCPFHNERTPSFTIYPKTNSFKCFGCGIGGSVIDFVMQMCGMDALEAAKKLDADFNLGLFDYKPSQEEQHKLKQQLKEQQAQREAIKGLVQIFESYINRAYSILCDYAHMLRGWKFDHAPKSVKEMDTGSISPLFVEACHQLDYIEYLLDYLTTADYDEQILFYQQRREEMVRIATKIKQYSKGA